MTNEQILSVLSLSKNPLIQSAVISSFKNSSPSFSISSALDADPEQVKELVSTVFPKAKFEDGLGYEENKDGSELYQIQWLSIDNKLSAVHFNKKTPAITQEPQENTHLDNTTDDNAGQYEADHIESWTPEQILAREG